MEITTLQDLRSHLQTAIEIEHSTIPAYLCALFSIEDQSSETAMTIKGVVLEEMLHMAIACNLLNAIGGEPRLTDPAFLPKYPGPLPHHAPDPPLVVHLQRCSLDLINDVFLEIEKPTTVGDIPEGDDYETLGQFYAAIVKGFETVESAIGADALFCGDRRRQVTSAVWSREGIFPVTDLSSAKAAIGEIVEQGEGTPRPSTTPRRSWPTTGSSTRSSTGPCPSRARSSRSSTTRARPSSPPARSTSSHSCSTTATRCCSRPWRRSSTGARRTSWSGRCSR